MGYIYRTVPEWFTPLGVKINPIKYSLVHEELYYRFEMYATNQRQNILLYLRTSDDIKPRIRDAVTGRQLRVVRESVNNGYTTWRVFY